MRFWRLSGTASPIPRPRRIIAAIETNIQSAIRAISASSSAIDKACDFLSPENIAGMVRWSSDPDCDFVLEEAALRRVAYGLDFQSQQGIFELRRPTTLVRGLLPDADELQRILDLR
jgi:hypothetical protein